MQLSSFLVGFCALSFLKDTPHTLSRMSCRAWCLCVAHHRVGYTLVLYVQGRKTAATGRGATLGAGHVEPRLACLRTRTDSRQGWHEGGARRLLLSLVAAGACMGLPSGVGCGKARWATCKASARWCWVLGPPHVRRTGGLAAAALLHTRLPLLLCVLLCRTLPLHHAHAPGPQAREGRLARICALLPCSFRGYSCTLFAGQFWWQGTRFSFVISDGSRLRTSRDFPRATVRSRSGHMLESCHSRNSARGKCSAW